MRAHPLPEARAYSDLMLVELRKVIPSFLKRVDLPDRGGASSAYLEKNRRAMQDLADDLFARVDAGQHRDPAPAEGPEVTLLDWDPDGEVKVVAAMLYPYADL